VVSERIAADEQRMKAQCTTRSFGSSTHLAGRVQAVQAAVALQPHERRQCTRAMSVKLSEGDVAELFEADA
jgi:hypothetical protein